MTDEIKTEELDTKDWWESRRGWGNLILGLSMILELFDIKIPVDAVAEAAWRVTMFIGLAISVWGGKEATKKISNKVIPLPKKKDVSSQPKKQVDNDVPVQTPKKTNPSETIPNNRRPTTKRGDHWLFEDLPKRSTDPTVLPDNKTEQPRYKDPRGLFGDDSNW